VTERPRPSRRPESRRVQVETSAGGIVYRRDGDDTLFLLIRDSYHNWGFPKGHLESNEAADHAALREVQEETGLGVLRVQGTLDTIDWHFRFRGKRVHKVCHFFLIETAEQATTPQHAEGITECAWVPYDQAERLIAYDNARALLLQAKALLVRAGVIGEAPNSPALPALPEPPELPA
jgi:8-oxo-dGTP pyrophosphatase MutT (NUDIX family)